jgi:hypothetical protein
VSLTCLSLLLMDKKSANVNSSALATKKHPYFYTNTALHDDKYKIHNRIKEVNLRLIKILH